MLHFLNPSTRFDEYSDTGRPVIPVQVLDAGLLVPIPVPVLESLLVPVPELLHKLKHSSFSNPGNDCLDNVALFLVEFCFQLSRIFLHFIFKGLKNPASNGCQRCVEFRGRHTNAISFSHADQITSSEKWLARLSPIKTTLLPRRRLYGINCLWNQSANVTESNQPDFDLL